MIKKISLPSRLGKWLTGILLLVFSVAPIYACLILALTPRSHMLETQLTPHYFQVSNFLNAFKEIYFSIGNSFFYAIATVVFTLVISIPVAYIVARYEFKAKKVMLFGLLLTQMIAGIVILPSLYAIYTKIGFINSRFMLILTLTGVNLALTIWLLVGFFVTLPQEVEDAAYIDGVSFTKLIILIIVPMSAPAIAVSAIFAFINSYNEFLVPLFLITDSSMQTITMKLYNYLSDTTVLWPIVGSAALIGLLPPVVTFLFFQKYIVSGITSGAVKS
jgi:ABC-type glycerol-3-phosphate transport system permease component